MTQRNAPPLYAALDLGTNNCRLLIVEPTPHNKNFRVRDSFSRIVRLGEGLEVNGALSPTAMKRTIAALGMCAAKIRAARVRRVRCVATEACRDAANGEDFIRRVRRETGLRLEIISGEDEAKLAAMGCGTLFDPKARHVIVFDIGGGSTEIIRLDKDERGVFRPADFASLPLGVVRLAERHANNDYTFMLEDARTHLADFLARQQGITDMAALQMIGTSGTVTTLAAVQLGLQRYDRARVDGCVLAAHKMRAIIDNLRGLSRDELAANGCIGHQRADLMLAGCAVVDVLHAHFPVQQLSVADRGLREGMLLRMINRDRHKSPRRVATRESHDQTPSN